MKPILYTSLLTMLNMTACALEPTSPVEPPPKISTFTLPKQPVSPIPPSAKAIHPLPKVVDQVVYFYGEPPEKQVIDFKRIADADHYFSLLSQKLRPRHGTVDAKTARDAGIFYLLADFTYHGKSLHPMTVMYSWTDIPPENKPKIVDTATMVNPTTNCYINRIQGYQQYISSPGNVVTSGDSKKFTEYYGLAFQYAIDWNYIMLSACANPTRNFKKPPDQRPQ